MTSRAVRWPSRSCPTRAGCVPPPPRICAVLEGVPAGIETVMVPHSGNIDVVGRGGCRGRRARCGRHLGLIAGTPQTAARPLEATDILVVAAYNAQVNADPRRPGRRRTSPACGWGPWTSSRARRPPCVIVSMACSAVAEAPRGMEFLLSRNRINVAVSRGQWRAVIVRAPELTNYLPTHPEGLEQLGGFIGLCQRSSARSCPSPARGHAHSSWPTRDMPILRLDQRTSRHHARRTRSEPDMSTLRQATPRDMPILRQPPQGTCSFFPSTKGHLGIMPVARGQAPDMSTLRHPPHGTCPFLGGHSVGHAHSSPPPRDI